MTNENTPDSAKGFMNEHGHVQEVLTKQNGIDEKLDIVEEKVGTITQPKDQYTTKEKHLDQMPDSTETDPISLVKELKL